MRSCVPGHLWAMRNWELTSAEQIYNKLHPNVEQRRCTAGLGNGLLPWTPLAKMMSSPQSKGLEVHKYQFGRELILTSIYKRIFPSRCSSARRFFRLLSSVYCRFGPLFAFWPRVVAMTILPFVFLHVLADLLLLHFHVLGRLSLPIAMEVSNLPVHHDQPH